MAPVAPVAPVTGGFAKRDVVPFVIALFAMVGCRAKTKSTVTPSLPTTVAAPVAKDARLTCPALDAARIAPFEPDMSRVKADVPPITDAKQVLAPFYERVAALARGTAKRHVRVGIYGDSNLTGDQLSGHQRRLLSARFGDAGHGYVALARPWGWYTHEDVRHHGTWPLFKQMAVTTDTVADRQYGMNNFAAESAKAGAYVWVATADASTATIGRTASRFELHYLKQKRGGSFDVLLDGKLTKTLSTAAEGFEPGFASIEAADAAHEVRCVVKGDGPVRFFGATLEREPPGIVIDSLGAGSLNFQRILMVEPTTRRAQLQRRQYDLFVLWLGMNAMWLHPNRQWIADVIRELRSALPGLPILVTTPPDSVAAGEKKSDPRIKQLETQLREVAAEQGVAFWSMREAMGGNESFLFFMSHRLASPDRHHLLREGAELLGERMLSALWSDLGKYVVDHPDAGCNAEPAPSGR